MKLSLTERIQKLLPADERLRVIDGGARDALVDPRWAALGRVRVYGFDPDKVEVDRLNSEARARGLDFHYFPAALWTPSGRATFYENQTPSGSSLLEQNRAVTDRWRWPTASGSVNARDIFRPVKTYEIDVISLDDWVARERAEVDFLKLNIQGGELVVLRSGSSLLRTVLGVLIEVSFVESYKGRPMFADVDQFLRAHDFTFFDLTWPHPVGRAGSLILRRHAKTYQGAHGQLVEAHALYFKDPIDFAARSLSVADFTTARVLKLACLAEAFGQLEYAFELLGWLVTSRPADPACQNIRSIAESAAAEYRASSNPEVVKTGD